MTATLKKTMPGSYEIVLGEEVIGKLFAAVGCGGRFTGSWYYYFNAVRNGRWSKAYPSGKAAWEAAKKRLGFAE